MKIVDDKTATRTSEPMPTSEIIANLTGLTVILRHPPQATTSETCTGGTEWTKLKRKTMHDRISSKMPANNKIAIKATMCSIQSIG